MSVPATVLSGSIDFSSEVFIRNPYAAYDALRTQQPCWMPHVQPDSLSQGIWLLFDYENVSTILKMAAPLSKQLSRIRPPGAKTSPMDAMMLNMDPPDHGRLRNLAAASFTPQSIRALEPAVAQIAQKLAGELAEKKQADFMTDFAIPLPIMVLSDIMDIPATEQLHFRNCSVDILLGHDSGAATPRVIVRQKEAMAELLAIFTQLIKERRAKPGSDFISCLTQAHDAGGQISGTELTAMCVFMMLAGHETTTNLIGTGLHTLLSHPQQFALLKQNPGLLDSAVEELLRYESPVQRGTFRVTTEACTIGGKTLQPGEQVGAVIGAANRDAAVFKNPHELDITRNPNRHLSFGLGIHFCLGAQLARTEARIAFATLLSHLPDIQLAGTPEWKNATLFRGLRTLPVSPR